MPFSPQQTQPGLRGLSTGDRAFGYIRTMNIRRVLLLAITLPLSSIALAQSPPPLEAYGSMPVVDLLTISPSGKRIAYRLTRDGKDVIVAVDRASGEIAGGINVGEIAARELRFVDDDNLIINAGRTSKMLGFRGRFDYNAAFLLNVPEQSIDQLLSRAKNLYPAQTGMGKIIAAVNGGESLLMPAYHSENPRVVAPQYGVYSVRLRDNRTRLVEEGGLSTIDWFADSEGEMLARVDYDELKNRYTIWSMSDSRELIYEDETAILPAGPVGLIPGDDGLVYAARPSGSDHSAFFRMDLEDGEITGPIMERERSSVEYVHDDIGRTVHGVRFSGFTPTYRFFDEQLDARIRSIVDALEGTSATLVSWSDDFKDIVMHLSGGWNSGVYVLFREGEPQPEVLASVRPDIPNEQVVPTVVTRYEARDGLEIPALLTASLAVRERGNAPLLVLPHGGPAAYDKLEFDWMAQYFASRGYAVLQPQFRGSSGFGIEFMRAGYGEWGGKMQSDIDDGVDHLVSSGLVDPARVCIAGASYGGYAALAAGAFSPDKYKCVASIAGISDLQRMLRSDRRKYGGRHWAISYWERQYGGEEFDWKALDDISPINFADQFEAPVLLIHGKRDTVVPIDQSKIMRRALQRADKDVTLVELDGEDHWLSYGESRLETLRALAEFVEKHL